METGAHDYAFLVVFILAAIVFTLVPLLVAKIWAHFFSPPKPGPEKNAIYECGLKSEGDAWIRFRSEYYLYAIVFLVFDVETVFLLPFAVAFTKLSVGAFLAFVFFLVLLAEGLVWAWMKGVLNWE